MNIPTTTQSALHWTHLTPDSVEAWAELTNVLAEADGTGEFFEPEDLAEELEESGFTPETDSWAVWDEDRLVAYGQLRIATSLDEHGRARCWLGGGVHPQWRGRGIGRELVGRMEVRARELGAETHPGAPTFFRARGELEGSDARRLLTHLGYRVVRFFNDLARPVPGDPLTVPHIEGVELINPTDEHEEAVRVAHTIAFRDHWGSTPGSVESWHDFWTSRSGRKQLSTLAVDGDGQVLAYVMAGQWVPRELYITIVGTMPEARGRGLAAACLTRTLELAARSGEYDKVELSVDSESPTGATRLYERLGFAVERTTAAMDKDA